MCIFILLFVWLSKHMFVVLQIVDLTPICNTYLQRTQTIQIQSFKTCFVAGGRVCCENIVWLQCL